jgi:hypothetical protein
MPRGTRPSPFCAVLAVALDHADLDDGAAFARDQVGEVRERRAQAGDRRGARDGGRGGEGVGGGDLVVGGERAETEGAGDGDRDGGALEGVRDHGVSCPVGGRKGARMGSKIGGET